jgi:hypothetical protein
MPTTRLFIECPHGHQQYILKKAPLTSSNAAYIENVAGAPSGSAFSVLAVPTNPTGFGLPKIPEFS